MKGIIAAGGRGSRLYPMTSMLSKHLLPLYDKPMIYFPLTTLMLSGIREILVVADSDQLPLFERLLGDGARWGLRLAYARQSQPKGIADTLIVGEEFLDNGPAALILGDNIFYGHDLPATLRRNKASCRGATIFCYQVSDPSHFGVVEFDAQMCVRALEEKPNQPNSNWAVTGLYFYDRDVVNCARTLVSSARGELEITDLNRLYLDQQRLDVVRLGRGMTWLDVGTPDALLEGAEFVRALERRQGLKIACPEEVALRMGYIDGAHFLALANELRASQYGQYLYRIACELS